MTKFILCIISFTWVCHSSFAQLNVRKLSIHNEQGGISFPIFSSSTNAKAANKINDFLQMNVADQTTAKVPEKDLFKDIMYQATNTNLNSYMESLSYEIPTNRKEMVSIYLHGTTMSAYPDFFESTYNFNSTTGDIIYIEDLFTIDGLKQLQRYIRDQRKRLMEQHLQTIKKDNDLMTDLGPDGIIHLQDEFNTCVSYFTYSDFFIEHDSLHFISPRCLPHSELPLDGEFPVSIAIQDWKNSLNSYGQKLLIEKSIVSNAYHANFYHRPLYGSIGKIPIVIYIDEPSESVNGFYYYPSQGIRINFFGSFSNNLLHVQANATDNPALKETIKATLSSNGLKGEWSQGAKKLPFVAN